jgi:hypothetical protein
MFEYYVRIIGGGERTVTHKSERRLEVGQAIEELHVVVTEIRREPNPGTWRGEALARPHTSRSIGSEL